MMPKKAHKSILSRMDFNSDTEKIILLDNIIDFDVSFIREILSMNISNPRCNVLSFLKIKLLYEYLFEKNEKTCGILNLKKNFDFIKVLNKKDNNIAGEMNFLVLKNKIYTKESILDQINDKPIFGNDIKNNLDIDEYPIDKKKYTLIEVNNNEKEKYIFYDKVYALSIIKDYEKYNDNEIMLKIKELENKMIEFEAKMGQKVNEKLNDFSKKLDSFVNILNDQLKGLNEEDI